MNALKKYYIDLATDKRKDPIARILQGVLSMLSVVYEGLVLLRKGIGKLPGARPARVGCAVVSVGNITWGGTRKTPLVLRVVPKLKDLGFHPAVISRAGTDEAALLRAKLPGIPVVMDADRHRAAIHIRKTHPKTDVLVLDDGLQQKQLRKDLDLVVLNARDPFGNGHLIPRGILRERTRGLARAQWILLNKIDAAGAPEKESLHAHVRRLNRTAPVAESSYRVSGIQPLAGGDVLSVDRLGGRPVALFSAIGDPAFFADTVKKLGCRIVFEHHEPDHSVFSDALIRRVQSRASRAGAEHIFVTEKDAVKIRPVLASAGLTGTPFFAVEVELDISRGEGDLSGFLRRLHTC